MGYQLQLVAQSVGASIWFAPGVDGGSGGKLSLSRSFRSANGLRISHVQESHRRLRLNNAARSSRWPVNNQKNVPSVIGREKRLLMKSCNVGLSSRFRLVMQPAC